MSDEIVLHTNHGGETIEEGDIPQILIDAYRASALEEEAGNPVSELNDPEWTAEDWSEEIKLEVMYAAQAAWRPPSGDQSSSWNRSHRDTALRLFKNHPEFMTLLLDEEEDEPREQGLNPATHEMKDMPSKPVRQAQGPG